MPNRLSGRGRGGHATFPPPASQSGLPAGEPAALRAALQAALGVVLRVAAAPRAWTPRATVIWAFLVLCAMSGQAMAQDARLHNMSGLAFFYDGHDREAYSEFVAALRADPSFAAPHFNIARIFERQGRYPQSIKEYEATLTIDPSYPGAKEALARLGFYSKEKQEAAYDPARILAEGDRTQRLDKARGMIDGGHLVEAKALLEAMLQANPADTDARTLLAGALEKMGDVAGAITELQQLKVVLPSSTAVALSLARDLYAIGLFQKAGEEAEDVLRLDPRNRDSFLLLARINITRGRKTTALRYLLEASRLSPEDAALRHEVDVLGREVGMTHYVSGIYYFSNKAWADAARELRTALAEGKLAPEERAIAQEYVIVAEFSLAKVREQIAAIQKEKENRERAFNDRQVSLEEVLSEPLLWTEGRHVQWRGWIVNIDRRTDGAQILITTDRLETFARSTTESQAARREGIDVLPGLTGPNSISRGATTDGLSGNFRATSDMSKWFLLQIPRPLPDDQRLRPNSIIRAQGKLGKAQFLTNPWNGVISRRPQPTVSASRIEVVRQEEFSEGIRNQAAFVGPGASTGLQGVNTSQFPSQPDIAGLPGIFGALRIDYLTYDEIQQKNR